MPKPEKRLSAFSIGLRCVNLFQPLACGRLWRVSPSVRARFGIQRSDKSLGIAQNLSTNFLGVLVAASICSVLLRAHKKFIFTSVSYL